MTREQHGKIHKALSAAQHISPQSLLPQGNNRTLGRESRNLGFALVLVPSLSRCAHEQSHLNSLSLRLFVYKTVGNTYSEYPHILAV